MPKIEKNNLVCVGVITSPRGIKGEVRVKTFTQNPESLEDYSPLYSSGGNEEIKLKVNSVKGEMAIVKVEGINSRNEAETLRGKELYADKEKFPEAAEDEFFYEDLIGSTVVLENGIKYGVVKNVDNYGGGDIVEISRENGSVELIAFTKVNFPKIDLENTTIVLSPPDVEFTSDNDK